MKKYFLIIGFSISCFVLTGQTRDILIGKWNIHKYIFAGFEFSPEEKEKNDYLHFKEDDTFISKESEKLEEGIWVYLEKEKLIMLYDENSKNENDGLPIEIVEVNSAELICIISDGKESIKVIYKK